MTMERSIEAYTAATTMDELRSAYSAMLEWIAEDHADEDADLESAVHAMLNNRNLPTMRERMNEIELADEPKPLEWEVKDQFNHLFAAPYEIAIGNPECALYVTVDGEEQRLVSIENAGGGSHIAILKAAAEAHRASVYPVDPDFADIPDAPLVNIDVRPVLTDPVDRVHAVGRAFMATRPDLPMEDLSDWMLNNDDQLTAVERATGYAILAFIHEQG